jgi:hypothetical protein
MFPASQPLVVQDDCGPALLGSTDVWGGAPPTSRSPVDPGEAGRGAGRVASAPTLGAGADQEESVQNGQGR